MSHNPARSCLATLAMLVGLAPAMALAQTQAASHRSGAELTAAIDSIADSLVSGPLVGMSVVVARGPELLLAKGYGLADQEANRPADSSTVFQIGSITKQFTAAAVMRLMEQGRISLDDEITKYLPDFPTQGHRVTVRHLLNHTSGIRSYTGFLRLTDSMSVRQIYDTVKTQPFDFAPGTDYRYNNSGYVMLGMILEKVTGKPYADLMQEWFFTPLGMTHSRYCGAGGVAPPEGYRPGMMDSKTRVAAVDMRVPFSAGAICASAPDLAKWTWALATGKVVKPESYAMMTGGSTLSSGRRIGYGFGLVADTTPDGAAMIQHGGGIPGFVTQMSYFPADSTIVVVLSNTETNMGRIAGLVTSAARGVEAPAPKDLAVPADVRTRIAGTYSLTGTPLDIRIFEENGQVMAQATNQSAFRLMYQGGNEFRASFDTDVRVVFADGAPAPEFTLYQGGARRAVRK